LRKKFKKFIEFAPPKFKFLGQKKKGYFLTM